MKHLKLYENNIPPTYKVGDHLVWIENDDIEILKIIRIESESTGMKFWVLTKIKNIR